jgi:transposase InsO family protein
MRAHRNARTTPIVRRLMVERVRTQGWSVAATARAHGVCRATVYKWLLRFEKEGEAGLLDRSSAAHRVWNLTQPRLLERIEALRRRRLFGRVIALRLKMPRSTVAGVLVRLGLASLRVLNPAEPVVRYERDRPGELLHLDVKKLGRFKRPGHRVHGDRTRRTRGGVGWEYVHVCIDDASRAAYAEILGDERSETARGFLVRALEHYRGLGLSVAQVMTDNGSAYVSRDFAALCRDAGVRHLRTRPYRPQTNGKAERFIQTLMREWAYARSYPDARARARALGPWLGHYNRDRPHGSLGGLTPEQRLRVAV